MGNSAARTTANKAGSKSRFEFLRVVGCGSYGKVWEVLQRTSKQSFAMKVMRKSRIASQKSVQSVLNELRLLTSLKHPFLVNMHSAFQDAENLYLVLDLMRGGDLRFNFARSAGFTEVQTRFYVACLLTALDYVHQKGVLHRDVKPENLVLDERGYLRLTDFGIARYQSQSQDSVGTPGYTAPELIAKEPQGMQVDYFAVGVIVYEIVKGRRPHFTKAYYLNEEQQQVFLTRSDVPSGWRPELADFVNKLLVRDPSKRLGANGPCEVKNHSWLQDFPWSQLLQKSLPAPYCPPPVGNYDASMFQDLGQENGSVRSSRLCKRMFADYFSDPNHNADKNSSGFHT